MKENNKDYKDGKYLYPLEEKWEKLLTPFDEFIRSESTSGIALIVAVVLALVFANSALSDEYHHLLEVPFAIGLGAWQLELPLHAWINEFLMVFFFFIVGLEIKREVLIGELSDLRQASLPVFAALGGMLVPALVFAAFNYGTPYMDGWAIPMATDIAFCVGLVVLLGKRVPRSLSVLLVALAIVDDLGAVMVIALFYTANISTTALAIAAGLLLLLVIFNYVGLRSALPFLVVGIILWLTLLHSGIHATVAGVLVAFCVPARPRHSTARFSRKIHGLLERFDDCRGSHCGIYPDEKQKTLLHAMHKELLMVEAPLQRMEHYLHLPVALLIIPIFAISNAGIPLNIESLSAALVNPVTQGIAVGLVFGKVLGIAGFAWLAVKLGIAKLPADIAMKHIIGMAMLGGIGFTMSIFIAELSFPGQYEILNMAKTGIFAASLFSGVAGYIWLYKSGPKKA